MAKKIDIDADLMLEIDGTSVTPEKFLRGVRAFFNLVGEVTSALVGDTGEVRWVVRVKSGSSLIGVVPSHTTVGQETLDNIYATVQRGIESIEHEAEEPDRFPEQALKHIRELASVAGAGGEDDTSVRVWAKKQPVPMTHKAVVHAAALLDEAYEDFGTVEGRVQVVSERGALHVYVAEPIRRRQIRCFFAEDKLPEFLAAFRKRVEIAGRIRYRRDGAPVSIVATRLTEFPDTKDLPSHKAVRGILRKIS